MLLTLPILAQNLLTSSFSLVDTLMISSLGTTALTAMGLAASWIQLLNVVIFGITGAAGVLVAQFWGAGTEAGPPQLRRRPGLLPGGLPCFFLAFTACRPGLVMSFYTDDPAVVEAGARYLRVVAFGFRPWDCSTANAVPVHRTGAHPHVRHHRQCADQHCAELHP